MVDFSVVTFVLLISLFSNEVASNGQYQQNFQADQRSWRYFLRVFNKRYSSLSELLYRKKIYFSNIRKIDEFNRKYIRSNMFFRCAINRYADLTNYEFVKQFTGLKFEGIPEETKNTERTFNTSNATVDWRGTAVTSVKRQQNCGACWSFAAAGALEGQLYLRKNESLESLSSQNLIDCVEASDTTGCEGGLMTDAYDWISKNGIMRDSEYQYEARDNNSCRYNLEKKVGSCSGSQSLPFGSESALQEAVSKLGPISIGIDASSETFQFYSSGIYFESDCDPMGINHAVLVVGFGSEEEGLDYWIVKNSWGVGWGENGYFRLARNRENHCGVATLASYPIVE